MRRSHLIFCIASALGIPAILFPVFQWANAYYLDRAQVAGQQTLVLVAEAVDQAVGRFAPIPALIAGDPAMRQVLQEEGDQGVAPFMNEKLRQIAIAIDASEVYVMDKTGLTVATSNYRDADSFLGRNFAFRPYFSRAIAGASTTFHALGITSGERGFFFSTPILDGIEVVGVLAVKITAEGIEQDWLGNSREILIADNNGIVFLTNRDAFKFRALTPLPQPVRDDIVDTQQFPMELIQDMGLSTDVIRPATVRVTLPVDGAPEAFVADSAPLGLAGWHAIVFTPLAPVEQQVFRAVAFAATALMALVLSVLLVLQRRSNILERMRIEQEQRALLEDRVRERTTDLNAANTSLRTEVAERRNAEERLRKSQKELVQAGKLAALGTMSAAISHEMNQPLAAIKSYAENASQFLDRSRPEDAKTNVESIVEMSDRMSEISKHLRNFARQPGDALKTINVGEVIDETIALVGPQLRAQNAEIAFAPPPQACWALGGRLRLQQVLVNVIANALEAMGDQKKPLIDIAVSVEKDRVEIRLRDHGPGLLEESLTQVFDAFYTTKTAGSGMGLGMSISHNIISDFGGALAADNHPDGGAVFTVSLQRDAEAGVTKDAS